MSSDKVLTIDDALEILQKAKEKYGNLPLEVDININVEAKDITLWDIKDILVNDESVTFYNY